MDENFEILVFLKYMNINPLPNDKIIALSKLSAFADDKLIDVSNL